MEDLKNATPLSQELIQSLDSSPGLSSGRILKFFGFFLLGMLTFSISFAGVGVTFPLGIIIGFVLLGKSEIDQKYRLLALITGFLFLITSPAIFDLIASAQKVKK